MENKLNLEKKLKETRDNRISPNQLMLEVQEAIKAEIVANESEGNRLENLPDSQQNDFILDYLDADKIFFIKDIEKACTTYRLRFIEATYFKTKTPTEALQQIKALEAQHKTKIENFKIMAPANLIRFKNTKDTFLFAPIGKDYYYLIDHWGDKFSTLRKWVMWPMKGIENMIGTILLLSLFNTFVIPIHLIFKGLSAQDYFIFFLFNFKWIVFLALFYGIAFGKNFSINNWQNKSYKT